MTARIALARAIAARSEPRFIEIEPSRMWPSMRG